MTSVENSTNKSEQYSGLNLGALQSLDSGEVTIDAAAIAQSDLSQSDLSLSEQGSDLNAQNDTTTQRENAQSESTPLPPPSEESMQDYYRLQQNLLGLTVAFGAVIFPFIWGFYSLQIALDYVLGACAGVVYLRMLGRNVSNIGRQKKNSSAGRLAVFAGIMIVALRWDQLDVIPVFLGFLTYKAAIIAFVLWTSVRPQREVA